MVDSLLTCLGLDKPAHHRGGHKAWKKQLVDSTRQLRLGADRARQKIELEMLDDTEVFSVGNGAGAEPALRKSFCCRPSTSPLLVLLNSLSL